MRRLISKEKLAPQTQTVSTSKRCVSVLASCALAWLLVSAQPAFAVDKENTRTDQEISIIPLGSQKVVATSQSASSVIRIVPATKVALAASVSTVAESEEQT